MVGNRQDGADIHGKNRRMFMNTQSPQAIPRSRHTPQRVIIPQIPKLDHAIFGRADQLPLAATLEMDAHDASLVLAPCLDEGGFGGEALVIDADGAVVEAGDDDVAFDLIGGH